MRRKTFDLIVATGGVVVAVVLLVAGSLLMWGHNFANSNVHQQLAQQQITFPATTARPICGKEITPAIEPDPGPLRRPGAGEWSSGQGLRG